MVTALSSTRLIAAQLALKVLQADDTTTDDSTSSTDSSSVGSSISNDVSSLPSSAQASLASMLNSLANGQTDDTTTSAATDASSTTAASTDITTASFMALLKQNLTATAAGSSDGAKQAQAMLTALDAGTLTVSDPTNGLSITAWDPTATTTEDATTSATTAATANTATTIPTTDWNDYLKAHLQRNTDGTFTRAADNSFVDKTSGNEAYFGQVGTQFYYLTWTDADSATAAGTAATTGVAATDATSA